MDEFDDEPEIRKPRRSRKKAEVKEFDPNVAERSTMDEIQAEVSRLVLAGKPVPKDLKMQLSMAVLATISDPDKKLRGLLSIMKTFKGDEVGLDDEELIKRTPKAVLQLIARQKGNKMNRFLSEMER